MTATQVDGVPVIADEPAQSTIKTHDGAPIYFKRIRELLLEDGRTVYGCVHCDFVRGSPMAIRPHLVKHPQPDAVRRPPKGAANSDLTLAQLLKKVETLEKITADRNQWKSRALKAEGQLATLRRTLRGDG